MRIGVALVAYTSTNRHHQFTLNTLKSIVSSDHDLAFCIVLNHPISAEWRADYEEFGVVLDNDENILSRGWNRGIDWLLAFGCDYVFVPNSDIELLPGSLDTFVSAAQQRPDYLLWTMAAWFDRGSYETAPLHDNWVEHPHFSAFMVDCRLFEVVGPFDEAFKMAYNEDIDMHWRIRLAGHAAAQYEGSRFYHIGSATILADSKLRDAVTKQHAQNDDYFKRKWKFKPLTGDAPMTNGMYEHPFDDPAMDGFEKRDYPPTW